MQDFNKSNTLLIWDSDRDYPDSFKNIFLWNSFNQSLEKNIISVPLLVEEHSIELREKFLNWIYEIGETHIKSIKIIDILEIESGLSYWWFTSLGQKFNISDSSPINDIIKIFAIEQYIDLTNFKEVHIVCKNKNLIKLFKSYSKNQKIKFSHRYNSKNYFQLNKLWKTPPNFIKAFLYLVWYFITNFKFLITKKSRKLFSSGILFIDILIHLNNNSIKNGKFISNYWTKLTELLDQLKIQSNWLHGFYRHNSIPNIRIANELLNKFNNSPIQSHSLFENYLTPKVFLESLNIYFKLYLKSFYIFKYRFLFKPINSSFDFYYLVQSDLKESLRGKEAMSNCIRIALTKSVFKDIPLQKKGFYIQENQPWELALIFYWKKFKHGTIYGVPHSTIRFWDLRYFFDKRIYLSVTKNNLPMPNYVALNGQIALDSYIHSGYPKVSIVKAEALRYLYLLKVDNFTFPKYHISKQFTILVFGDFLKSTNDLMINCLINAISYFDKPTKIIIKPHPSNQIVFNDYPNLNFELTNGSILELMNECTLVFTSNITSAAVDVLYCKKPLVQFLDGSYFNVSPLKNIEGVIYVKNSDDLLYAMNNIPQPTTNKLNYFFLSENLTYWKSLIGDAN
jgi:surface carbohydrate biosynthesis protein (TIGR04326 family)